MTPLMMVFLSQAEARTWTVDAAGAGDVTTVEEGVALLSDGDTLQVMAGTYEVMGLYVFAKHVRIVGAGPDDTIFAPPDSDGDGGTGGALVIFGGDVTLEGIGFDDYASYADGITVEVYGETAIEHCRFTNNHVSVWLNSGVNVPVAITDSAFIGNRGGIDVVDTVDTLIVENNLFIDNDKAIYFGATYTWGYFNLISIVHNTFAGSGSGASIGNTVRGYDEGWSYELLIVNNAFIDVRYPWFVDLAPVDPAYGEIRNNVYTPGSETFLDEGSPIVEADNLEADVSFVAWSDDGDWTNDDLHLVEGSPAIDVGVDGYATWPADADGYTRPIDGDGDGLALPDAGAYELCPTGDCPLADLPDEDTGDTDGSGDSGDTGAHDTGTSPTDTGTSPTDTAALAATGCGGAGCATARPRGLLAPALAALAVLRLRRTSR